MPRPSPNRLVVPVLSVAMALSVAFVAAPSGTAGAAGVPGVTATRVTIGATVPLTGIASTGYDQVAKAANAVFKWVNTRGGVNGRTINYVIKDDCYDAPGNGCEYTNPSTVTQTQKLLALPVFATVGSLGTPTQQSVMNLLRSNGVPQLFVNSGSSLWNNPVHYPNLTGWQPSYVVESKILGHYVRSRWPGQKVCFIGQDDDFGHNGYAGLAFAGLVPTHPGKDDLFYSVASLVSSHGASFNPYISQFQTDNCKVVYLDTIPGATGAALGNALALSYTPHWVISSVGSDPWTVKQELGATPDTEAGAVSFGFLPASTQASSWHAWMYRVLEHDPADFKGFNSKSTLNGNEEYGIGWGVAFVEALKAAGRNFTRATFMKTLLTTSFQTSALVPLRYGGSNHQGLEGGLVTEIKSTSQTEVLNPTLYLTTSAKSSPLVKSRYAAPGIPRWLQ